MPMPVFDDRSYEYMEHTPNVPAFGKHEEPYCMAESHTGWFCTRQEGHMGRHEAGSFIEDDGRRMILASWADRPE